MIPGQGSDNLLVANNLSDNALLLDAADGHVLQQFDLSTNQMIPASFPYTVVATRDGRRAWCSLWNASNVAELDLASGRVARWISLLQPKSEILPGSHPTALLLSPDEKLLYVALSNADAVAAVNTSSGEVIHLSSTNVAGQQHGGTYPSALALSADGKRLFIADASLNAVAVFDTAALATPGISVPLYSHRLVSERASQRRRRSSNCDRQRPKHRPQQRHQRTEAGEGAPRAPLHSHAHVRFALPS